MTDSRVATWNVDNLFEVGDDDRPETAAQFDTADRIACDRDRSDGAAREGDIQLVSPVVLHHRHLDAGAVLDD
jgi:hypothetical protein